MVGIVGLLGLGVLVMVHIAIAAIAVRLLRVRLSTRWAPIVFALLLVPIVLFASTLAVTGGLGLGPDIGSPRLVVYALIVVPLGLGMAIDYLWMPAPEAVELPTPDEP